jgi:PAS domain S-box-containing protein
MESISLGASLSPARTYDVKLVVSEAVANAVEHATAEGDIEIVVWLLADRIIIEVTNPGAFQPRINPDSEERRRGLGLPLMLSLADQVHVSRPAEGKTLVSVTFFHSEGAGSTASAAPGTTVAHLETERLKAEAALVEAARREAEAEREIHELSQRLSYHMEHSPLAVIEWGSDMRLVRWSGEAERMFGWRADEVLGRRMEDFRWVYTEDTTHVAEVSTELRNGTNPRRFSANRNYRKDGSLVYCEWYNSSLLDESGNLQSILSLVLDVTERRLLEEAQRVRDEDLARDLSGVGRLRLFERPAWMVIVVGAAVQVAVLWGVDRLGSPSHYLGVPGAAAALIGVVASILAGPVAGTTVALAGGAAYFAFLTDFGTTVDRPVVVASILLWTLAAALAGLAADWVRRNAGARERLLSLALGKHERLANSLNMANRGLQSQNEQLAAREEELLSQAEELARLGELNERLYQAQKSIAERLQLSLLDLPDHLQGVVFAHVYRSATEEAFVGGDFYDVFEAGEGRIGILIGDVCGHGVEAARTATRVKDTVNAFSHGLRRPHEVLRETNLLLIERRISGFVTVFLGFLDVETGELDYSSAGHPAPVIMDGDSGMEYLGIPSFPLGLFHDSTYDTRTAGLGEDALLVLYTDGIIEARCERAFFGEAGLLESLRRHRSDELEALPSAILGDVLAFSGGALKDDVALLALRLSETGGHNQSDAPLQGVANGFHVG